MPLLVEIDLDELAGLAAKLDADGRVMRGAAQAAANRTVRWARSQVQRELAGRLGVPQGALKGRLKALAARRGRTTAALWIALLPLNVVRARPRRTRRGLSTAREDFPAAFVGSGKYGGKVAMRRKGEPRTPLEAVSLDVATAAKPLLTSHSWPRIQEQFIRYYRAELERRAAMAVR